MTTIDPNGRRVLAFTSDARNLSRIAALTDAVIDIAISGAWRDYSDAVGHTTWREAELDYFLIACDLRREDISRVLTHNKQAKALAPLMDRDVPAEHRRPLGEASSDWKSPTGESLVERAKRLGWAKDDGTLNASPVPARARTWARYGDLTKEEHARRERLKRIPIERRHELDHMAKSMREQLTDEQERRYFIEQLARDGTGRPAIGVADSTVWRADAERLGWNTTALAEYWNVAVRTAQHRIKQLREVKS